MAVDPEKTPPPAPHDDVVLVHGRTDDGKGLQVLRKQGDTLSIGQVRPLEEGKPVQGEVVKLRPRGDMPFVADVEVLYRPEAHEARASGPAQVATPAYRDGWDAIWGEAKKPRGERPAHELN